MSNLKSVTSAMSYYRWMPGNIPIKDKIKAIDDILETKHTIRIPINSVVVSLDFCYIERVNNPLSGMEFAPTIEHKVYKFLPSRVDEEKSAIKLLIYCSI
jgi:hypothetical protein